MKVLHLCLDHNFIENSQKIFESFYPNQNIFLINSKGRNLKIIKQIEHFLILNLDDQKNFQIVESLCRENSISKIVLHGMDFSFLPLIKLLSQYKKYEIYWIFWGYELYQTLAYEKGYELIDDCYSIFEKSYYLEPNTISKILRKIKKVYLPSIMEQILPYISYFCFWNKYDYDLLNRYYDTSIKFKFFAYGANKKEESPKNLFPLKEKTVKTIMINHQASLFGNHVTVFDKIMSLDVDNKLKKLVPLSYGSEPIRNRVIRYGTKMFEESFQPILNYMKRDDYFKMIENVEIAIFGQRRQEASGNIIQLLKNGVKVFLRNDNSLLNYYRRQGYIIFSYEDDLNRTSLFKPLSIEEQNHNRQCYLNNRFYYDDYMPGFFNN